MFIPSPPHNKITNIRNKNEIHPPPIDPHPQGTPPATPMWRSDDYYIPSSNPNSNNSSMDVSGALDLLNNDIQLQEVLKNCFNLSDDHILLEDSFSGQTQENVLPFNSSFW